MPRATLPEVVSGLTHRATFTLPIHAFQKVMLALLEDVLNAELDVIGSL
jgi:hypothetical protein